MIEQKSVKAATFFRNSQDAQNFIQTRAALDEPYAEGQSKPPTGEELTVQAKAFLFTPRKNSQILRFGQPVLNSEFTKTFALIRPFWSQNPVLVITRCRIAIRPVWNPCPIRNICLVFSRDFRSYLKFN